MRWKLSNLIGEYQARTGERLSYRDIAAGAGLAPGTVNRIANNNSQRVDMPTLDGLIAFFNARGLEINTSDLLTWEPDGEGEKV